MRELAPAFDTSVREAVEAVVTRNGRRMIDLEALPGGRNNRVFRVTTDTAPLLAKAFYRDAADPRDRLGAEVAFTAHARRCVPASVPGLLAVDEERGVALYEYVEGQRLRVEEIDDGRIDEAVDFVIALNRDDATGARRTPVGLPAASEACFSLDEHLATVARRVEALDAVVEEARETDAGEGRRSAVGEAASLISARLRPAWEAARREVERAYPVLDEPIPAEVRCASPSDFGFHNAIRTSARDGALVFHDFEYGGIDDPVKLLCDFRCQPELPVSPRHGERFSSRVVEALELDAAEEKRASLLLPVYRVKWCCIMLAEFLPEGRGRRRFAAGKPSSEVERMEQVAKAQHMLDAGS